jgi:hypothetical protein
MYDERTLSYKTQLSTCDTFCQVAAINQSPAAQREERIEDVYEQIVPL